MIVFFILGIGIKIGLRLGVLFILKIQRVGDFFCVGCIFKMDLWNHHWGFFVLEEYACNWGMIRGRYDQLVARNELFGRQHALSDV